MNLIKWVPNSSTISVFNEVDNIFNKMLNIDSYRYNTWSPSFNVSESNKQFIVYADLPGVDKKNINIELEDGIINISGERMSKCNNSDVYYTNNVSGKFSRSFNLPDNCNGEKITAKLSDGVLELTIPKVDKVRDFKKINIR